MKKILLLALGAIMSASAAFAANPTFGVKAGFDMTNFWGKDLPHGMKPSYQAGVFMEYRFAGTSFAIAPEVVFASQGGKFNIAKDVLGINIGSHDKKLTYNTNYINIPVMFKYYVSPDFSIDFGPQLGINVYSKVSVEGVDKAADMSDRTKTVDFALGLGGTYNLTSNAFLQARYTMGMTDVFKDVNAKNGNIQIAFGYRF